MLPTAFKIGALQSALGFFSDFQLDSPNVRLPHRGFKDMSAVIFSFY